MDPVFIRDILRQLEKVDVGIVVNIAGRETAQLQRQCTPAGHTGAVRIDLIVVVIQWILTVQIQTVTEIDRGDTGDIIDESPDVEVAVVLHLLIAPERAVTCGTGVVGQLLR